MSAADDARLGEVAEQLRRRIDAVLGDWIAGLVRERAGQWTDSGGRLAVTDVDRAAAAAAARARDRVLPEIAVLLAADVDRQRTNPLDLLRRATREAGKELAALGVPPVERDAFSVEAFPDDDYDLVPASWSDIDPSLHEPGMTWGAAKAFVFKSRRRR